MGSFDKVKPPEWIDKKPTSVGIAIPNTELWLVPGCEHVKAFDTHTAEWEQRVLAFLRREIP